MRLSKADVNIIKSTLQEHLGSVNIYLFGSRADDSKKGGDIDIFVEAEKEISLYEKIRILYELEAKGIQRRIDLIIDTPGHRHKMIGQDAIRTGVRI